MSNYSPSQLPTGWSLPHLCLPLCSRNQPPTWVRCRPQCCRQRRQHGAAHGRPQQAGQACRDPSPPRPRRPLWPGQQWQEGLRQPTEQTAPPWGNAGLNHQNPHHRHSLPTSEEDSAEGEIESYITLQRPKWPISDLPSLGNWRPSKSRTVTTLFKKFHFADCKQCAAYELGLPGSACGSLWRPGHGTLARHLEDLCDHPLAHTRQGCQPGEGGWIGHGRHRRRNPRFKPPYMRFLLTPQWKWWARWWSWRSYSWSSDSSGTSLRARVGQAAGTEQKASGKMKSCIVISFEGIITTA